MLTLSATVVGLRDGQELPTTYYIRSVPKGLPLLRADYERTRFAVDAWAAYVEERGYGDQPVKAPRCISDAPRETIEEAAADMRRELRRALDGGARLAWGEVPPESATAWVGPGDD